MDQFLENIIEGKVKKILKKKKKKEMEEIVDFDGNVMNSKIPPDYQVKTITSKSTTDDVAHTAHAVPHEVNGTGTGGRFTRYWGEADLTKSLGYEDTMGQDLDYNQAKKHFEDDLGLDSDEAKIKMKKLGYLKAKNKDKVRLIEEPKQFLEKIVDSVLDKQSVNNDITDRYSEEPKEINPIVMRQLHSLKESLKYNNLSLKDVIKYLK